MAGFSHLCLVISMLGLFLPVIVIASPEAETEALLEFKSLLKDPANALESWKPGPGSPCGFLGVTCDVTTGNVVEVSLENVSLSGPISPSVAKLGSLTTFSLPSNSISGKVPHELANCSHLRVLNLTGNEMVGRLPDFSMLRDLEILDFSANYFTGELPKWFGNLTGLVSLVLADNDFDEGEIPASIGNLKNLTWLHLGECHLRGEIPEEIFGLSSLKTLDLSDNRISGKFPKAISRLHNLVKVELFKNNLTGEIPPELGDLTALQEIDISANTLYGKLPDEIGNLTSLTVFQCYANDFSGELPQGLGNLRHLKGLSIYTNRFSGTFPANLGRFSPLDSIDISENQFSGEFPRFLCENRKLRFLLALENDFSGGFPDSYADCKSLERLRLTQNRLSGTIPDGVWALPNVKMVDFGNNQFTGGISPSIRNSTSLEQLVLQNNRFSGKIPSEIAELRNLQRLYLNNNSFSGNIPPEFGNLEQLWSLHLEMNSITGTIPEQLTGCSKLVDLNLAFNSLSGNIPSSISFTSSLNSLNVSGNQLTGPIPESLMKLKLSSIDVSGNRLSGEIPPDLLTMGGEKAFLGNEELCVDPSSKTLVTDSKIPICPTPKLSKKSHAVLDKLVLLIIMISALFAVIVGLLMMSYKSFRLGEGAVHDQENGDFIGDDKRPDDTIKWKLATIHQVEIDAADICNLEEANLIGSGGTGKVYRLELKKKSCGNLTVAVKRLRKEDGVKLLLAEMETLGKIRHRNILKLYSCLIKGGSSYLVFEYMPNGNLFGALHGEVEGKRTKLDWYQRYRVALGAARGIAYLHHDCSPPIIHRDIKSTNILLDEDYEPKIADFGVAKVVEVAPGNQNFSCFAGTYGYIAPELAYTLKVSEKTDVYSFGIVLLELITGKRPIEEEFGEGKDIVYWVVTHLRDRESVLRVLDSEVVSDSNSDDMIKVLKVAVICTSKLPSLRPSMRDVVKMLSDAEPCPFKAADHDPDKNQKVLV